MHAFLASSSSSFIACACKDLSESKLAAPGTTFSQVDESRRGGKAPQLPKDPVSRDRCAQDTERQLQKPGLTWILAEGLRARPRRRKPPCKASGPPQQPQSHGDRAGRPAASRLILSQMHLARLEARTCKTGARGQAGRQATGLGGLRGHHVSPLGRPCPARGPRQGGREA